MKKRVNRKFSINSQFFKAEEAWLEEISIYVDDFVKVIKENAEVIESLQDRLPSPPENRVSLPWIDEVFTKINGVIQDSLNDILRIAKRMAQVKDEIRKDKKQLWLPKYKSVRLEHEKLKKLFEEKGIDINQHEKLLQQRELLKKEIRELKRIDKDIEGVNEEIQDHRNGLIELHKKRQSWRKGWAEKLETSDADIRIEVKEFGDCSDLIMRKEEWFGGTGLRDEDWQMLADYVFLEEQRIPERMDMLVSTLRTDIERSIRDLNFSEKSSAVVKILKDCGLKELSGHFFRALQRRKKSSFWMRWSFFYQKIKLNPRFVAWTECLNR